MIALVKLALKRDPSVPMGQPAPLHLDCPCGRVLSVPSIGYRIGSKSEITCGGCGNVYTAHGWLTRKESMP